MRRQRLIERARQDDSDVPVPSDDMAFFELDFATALNVMLGLPYEKAVEEGRRWVQEATGR